MRRGVLAAALLLVVGALIGVAFAGSRTTLAAGSEIAGIDVGGLSVDQATALLTARAKDVERVPITFVAGGESFELSSSQLGVEANWAAAVRVAAAEGDGFGPVRGFRRLHTRIFGAEVAPALSVYTTALDYKLDQVAAAVDRGAVDARLERKGLRVAVVPGQSGRKVDREAAANLIVRSLGAFRRGTTVVLPVVPAPPRVQQADLATAAAQVRTALSAPVRLVYGTTRWRLPRWRIAALLELPTDGATRVAVAGDGAERYLERLAKTVGRAPRDARFQVTSKGQIVIAPSRPGLELDMPSTVKALSAALFSPTARTANLAVRVAAPERTTQEASAMGITGVVGSYTTTYGGTEGRLHNVQLVARLIDGTLVAPGATFSFNDTTGERNAEKGFEDAPVIINGELQNGIGGGVCQVSTTVFNAAFEAGLQIDRRTNHALYISHYPLGRDATVNFPDLDLRFTNDTEHWLLLRTFVGTGSLTVNLYGTPGRPQGRERDGSTRRDREDPGQGDGRSHAEEGHPRGRPGRRAAARDQRAPRRLRHRRHGSARRRLALLLPRRAFARPGRHEGAAEEEAEAGAGRRCRHHRDYARGRDSRAGAAGRGAAGDDSAVATAATNHPGTRVGTCVSRSTVACVV